jgi:hypothetical protein
MSIRDDLRGTSLQDDPSTGDTPEEAPWWTDLVIAAVIAIAFIVVHVGVPGAVPSGADPGIWLAFAKERFGVEVMAAADAAYLPGFPVLVGLLLTMADSITAITVAGVISKVALVLAIYLVARPAGRGYGVAAAVMVGMSGAHAEMYAWGGYIQQLGTASAFMAVFFLVRYLELKNSRHFALSGVAVALTLVTHNLLGGLLVGALFVAAIHWLYLTRASRREWIRGLTYASIVAIPAGIFVAVYLFLGQRAGRQPSLNPTELTWGGAIRHVSEEAPIPWLIVTVLAFALAVWRRWSSPNATTVAVGGSWVVVSLAFFLAIGEPRALLLTQTGLVLIAVPGYAVMLKVASERNVFARDALAVIGGVLLLAVVASGYTDYDQTTDFYRAVGKEEIGALHHLMEVSGAGDLVVASEGERGAQVGWWVMGYAERPTYPGGNVAFLASPAERAQGAKANEVFAADPSESARLLDQIGARFVVVDRRAPSAGWLDSEFARSLEIIDDRSNLVILELPSD